MKQLFKLAIVSSLLAGCAVDPAADDSDVTGAGGKADSGGLCASPTWSTEVVATGKVGRFTTYRIDRHGTEHVLFRDDSANTMVYAERAAGASGWHKEALPCTNVREELWEQDPRASANANMVISDAGDVHVMCTRPAQEPSESSGALFTRAHGTAAWSRADLPATFHTLPYAGTQRTIGSSIALGPDGRVHIVTLAKRITDGAVAYDVSALTHWTYDAGVFAKQTELGYPASERGGFSGTSVSLCVGADAAVVAGPLRAYMGTHTFFSELRLPTAAATDPTTSTLIRYDIGSFVNASGFQPSCAIDAQGRAFHAAYDRSNNYVTLLRKGQGTPVGKFQDGGMYPDVKTAGTNVYMSYNAGDALRLVSLVETTTDVIDVDNDGVGQHTSLAIDDAGMPRIAYYDQSELQLKLATPHCD